MLAGVNYAAVGAVISAVALTSTGLGWVIKLVANELRGLRADTTAGLTEVRNEIAAVRKRVAKLENVRDRGRSSTT